MKVILKEDVKNIGKEGDTLVVADGFGRNFLLPKGLAVVASPQSLKLVMKEKDLKKHKAEKLKKEAEDLALKITRATCSISRKAGESDRLFGSVTAQDIADNLKSQGIDIDKRIINLEEQIKSLGDFTVPIKLHPEVIAQLTLKVSKEE